MDKDSEELSAREKLILATIECIEEEGIQAVTTRSIAKKANVNSAAINYYFGTKDNLLEQTLKSRIEHTFSDISIMIEENKGSSDLLVKEILSYIVEGMINYQGLIKAVFYDPLINNDYDNQAVKWLNEVLKNIFINIKNNSDIDNNIKLSIVQMTSSTLFLGLSPNFFNEFLGINFKDKDEQKKYVDYMVKHYFNKNN